MVESDRCPVCGSTQLREDAPGGLVCAECGTVVESAADEQACPVCHTLNPAQAMRCMQCGSALGRLCAVCAHRNLPGVETCANCGTPLDTLAAVTTRMPQSGERQRHVERLVASKRDDTAYMQEQRARLDAEERERLFRLAEQQARHREEQRRMILYVGIGIALVIVLVAFVVLALLLAA